MGLNHDRGTKNACSAPGYNYGWNDPQAQFASIMAYDCTAGQCLANVGGGCQTIQMFSNTEYLHMGKKVGDANNNNARKLNEVAAEVAAYRDAVVPPGGGGGGTCTNGELPMKLVLKTDEYPEETTWKIVQDSTGSIVANGGPYSAANTEVTIEECLPDVPHTFIITDAYGDGICCGYGSGDYKLYFDGALVSSGGSFSYSTTATFGGCTDMAGWVDSYGDDCSWYVSNDDPGCPTHGNSWIPASGIAPKQACCHCQL